MMLPPPKKKMHGLKYLHVFIFSDYSTINLLLVFALLPSCGTISGQLAVSTNELRKNKSYYGE